MFWITARSWILSKFLISEELLNLFQHFFCSSPPVTFRTKIKIQLHTIECALPDSYTHPSCHCHLRIDYTAILHQPLPLICTRLAWHTKSTNVPFLFMLNCLFLHKSRASTLQLWRNHSNESIWIADTRLQGEKGLWSVCENIHDQVCAHKQQLSNPHRSAWEHTLSYQSQTRL